ncbi:MAG: endo-1,4-beta-xylanase [Bacteroidales bacterium]|nr:endo-1,4-beta-xylanase [Bacteroidales bacterium]
MRKQACILNVILLYFFCSPFIFGQDLPVVLQAESGVLGSDFRVVDTLGVTCVTVKTNLINSYNPGNASRVISFEATFPDSGTYDLYARILTGRNTYDDDSYFYGNGFGEKDPATDNNWIRANGLAGAGYSSVFDVVDGAGSAQSLVWKWINFSKYTGDSPPVSFRVDSGELTQIFQIGGRENGLYIDKLVFGRSGLYFTVSNLNRGEPGSLTPPSGEPTTQPIAAGSAKFLGSAWDYEQAPFFAGYWNQLTPGNAGKWGSVEYTRDVMNWTVLDSAYKVARKYKMPIKEHTLIWGAQQPPWIGALDSAGQRQEIEEWFAALADRYDTIEYIDVVNEPIHNAPNGMIPWGTTVPNVDYAKALGGAGTTGWDWIINAFRLARQYFPDSKLILNEYSVINSTSKTQQYIEIINLLKAESLIDGIGEQAHAFTTSTASTALLKSNLDLLAATGIPIYITEMDVDGLTDLAQLKEFQRIFPLFWEHPAVEGITMWGYRYPVWRQEQGAHLITNENIERTALTWLKAYVNDTLTLTGSIIVTATGNTDSIFVNDKLQMHSTVLPANTTIPNVTWSITPSGLATINANGLLTATAAGTITVKATAWDGSEVSGSHAVVISNKLVESVSVAATGNKDTIYVNETLQMIANILPENATNKSVRWSTSPSGVAQISSSGMLTALSAGTAIVKAASNDGTEIADSTEIVVINKLAESITISVTENTDTMYVDDTLHLIVSVLPLSTTDKSFTWGINPDDLANLQTSGALVAEAPGVVVITAKANDASGISDTIRIFIKENISGILEEIGLRDILVFPNPSSDGSITIQGTGHIKNISITDLAGNILMTEILTVQESYTLYHKLNPGIYILKLDDGKKCYYRKIAVN